MNSYKTPWLIIGLTLAVIGCEKQEATPGNTPASKTKPPVTETAQPTPTYFFDTENQEHRWEFHSKDQTHSAFKMQTYRETEKGLR
jgi:hypothetical protein